MVTLFRKLLIRLGKIIPFVLAFILLVGYVETIYSIITNNTIVDAEENIIYNLPTSFFLADIVYIDWLDVLLVWILCVALELCKYSFRCACLITLNLPFRWIVAHVSMPDGIVIGLYVFMALAGLYCVCVGIIIFLKSAK
jgi:hypothetical protein